MKRQLSILSYLFFLLVLLFSLSGYGKEAIHVTAGKACLSREINSNHASLCSAGTTRLADSADDDAADDDSDDDYSPEFYTLPFVLLHTDSPITLSDTATHYLKFVSRHLITPHLFLSNRTLRL